jgi:hypothetical protein
MAVDLTKLRLERIQRSGRLDDAGKSVSMIGRPPWFGASGRGAAENCPPRPSFAKAALSAAGIDRYLIGQRVQLIDLVVPLRQQTDL